MTDENRLYFTFKQNKGTTDGSVYHSNGYSMDWTSIHIRVHSDIDIDMTKGKSRKDTV